MRLTENYKFGKTHFSLQSVAGVKRGLRILRGQSYERIMK